MYERTLTFECGHKQEHSSSREGGYYLVGDNARRESHTGDKALCWEMGCLQYRSVIDDTGEVKV